MFLLMASWLVIIWGTSYQPQHTYIYSHVYVMSSSASTFLIIFLLCLSNFDNPFVTDFLQCSLLSASLLPFQVFTLAFMFFKLSHSSLHHIFIIIYSSYVILQYLLNGQYQASFFFSKVYWKWLTRVRSSPLSRLLYFIFFCCLFYLFWFKNTFVGDVIFLFINHQKDAI